MQAKLEDLFFCDADFTAFCGDCGEVKFSAFKSEVGRLASYFSGFKDAEFALHISRDAHLFSKLFFALLQAGKAVYLAPSEEIAESIKRREGVPVISNAGGAVGNFRLPQNLPEADFKFKNMRGGRVYFFTSGSTSAPKTILKLFGSLSDETLNSAKILPHGKNTRVLATCEPCHLYGMLWRILCPLALGLEIDNKTIKTPEELIARQSSCESAVIETTPSFIEALAKYRDIFFFPRNCIGVTTSGGLLKKEFSESALAMWGRTPMEIFGSTESGGIAVRNQSKSQEWEVFERVEVGLDDRGCINAKSPYACGGFFQLNDMVELLEGGRKFLLRGRIDRLAKVGETQVFLPDLESVYCRHSHVENIRIEMLGETLRALVVPSLEGKLALLKGGKLSFAKELNRFASSEFERKLLPKKFRIVNRFPLNPQGKLLFSTVKNLLLNKIDEPLVFERKLSENGFSCRLSFLKTNSYFKGHFPSIAILPGVVQLYFAEFFIRENFEVGGCVRTVKKLKFSNVIRPLDMLELKIEKAGGGAFSFEYSKGGAVCSSALIEFANV